MTTLNVPSQPQDPSTGQSVCDVLNADASSDWLIICEHASAHIPGQYADLGVTPADRYSHIAWDPGAAEVSRRLGERLAATVVLHRYSRLLFDCNRSLEHPDAIREVSEGRPIPGNQGLAAHERQARAEQYYHPFHERISALLDAREEADRRTRLVTIHSFNPVYLGAIRHVELGIIGHDTETLALNLYDTLHGKLPNVAWNEPYSAADDVTHTVERHSAPRDLKAVMVEIRNDLIATADGQRLWANHLADGLQQAARNLD